MAFPGNRLLLASGNAGKLRELQSILADFAIQLDSPQDLGLNPASLCDPDGQPISIEETGSTFRENAQIKALGFFRASTIPSLSDDSGLCVDALKGAPGVQSARFGGEGLSDADRNELLLRKLQPYPEVEQRKAQFVCVLCLCMGPGQFFFFEGRVEGFIAGAPQGQGGFGYDPVFIEESTGKCFGTMSPVEKASLSHRGRALRRLSAFLAEG